MRTEKDEIARLKAEVLAMQKTNINAAEKMPLKNYGLDTLKVENAELRNKLSSALKKARTLELTSSEKDKSISELLENISKLKLSVEKAMQSNELLSTEIESSAKKIRLLESDIEEKNVIKEEIISEKEKNRILRNDLIVKSDLYNDAVEKLNGDALAHKLHINGLIKKHEKIVSSFETESVAMKNTIDALNLKIQEFNNKNETRILDGKEKSTKANEQIENLNQLILNKSSAISELEKKLKDFDGKIDCYNTLKIKNSELESKISLLIDRLQKSEAFNK